MTGSGGTHVGDARCGARGRGRVLGGRLAVCGVWLLWACGGTDVIADIAQQPAGEGEAGASAESAGSAAPIAEGTLEAWCDGQPALYVVRADGRRGLECAGELAASSFGTAVCVCNAATGPGVVTTTVLGASSGAVQRGATVAVNGEGLVPASGIASPPAAGSTLPIWQVAGDLLLAGESPLRLAPGSQRIRGDLRSRAPLSAGAEQTALRIDADAWLPAASTLDPRMLDVGGELVLSPAGSQAADAARWSGALVGGQTRSADLSLPPPCPCGVEQRLDVPATVQWASEHNDNAQLPFTPEQLYWVAQPTTLSLPCGRYQFPTINGTGVLTLRIDQPVALFVGDFLGNVVVELGPAGSLDLFISGIFQPRGGMLGNRERPAATRIYVHDQPMPGPLALIGEMVSNLYAPTVGVQAFGNQRRGSMVVRDVIVTDTLRVDYDPNVSALAGACGEP